MDLDYKDELDKKIKRTSKGARSSWGIFAPVHEFMRRKFRWYHSWHSRDYSRLVHMIVLAVYLIGYSAIALLIGLNLLGQYDRTKAITYNDSFQSDNYGETYRGLIQTSGLWDSKNGELRLRDEGDGNITGNRNGAVGVTTFNPRMTTDKMPFEGGTPTYAYIAWNTKIWEEENGDIYLQKINLATGEPDAGWGQAQQVAGEALYEDEEMTYILDLDYVHVDETNEDFLYLVYMWDINGSPTNKKIVIRTIDVTTDTATLDSRITLSNNTFDGQIDTPKIYDVAEEFDGQVGRYDTGGIENTFYHYLTTRSADPELYKKVFYNRMCADKDPGGGANCPKGADVGASNTNFGGLAFGASDFMGGGIHEHFLEGAPQLQVAGQYIYATWNSLLTNDVVPGGFDGYRILSFQKRNWSSGIQSYTSTFSGIGVLNDYSFGGKWLDRYHGEYDADDGYEYREMAIQDLILDRSSCNAAGSNCVSYAFWKISYNENWPDVNQGGLVYGQKIKSGTCSELPDYPGGLCLGWDGGNVAGYKDEIQLALDYKREPAEDEFELRLGISATFSQSDQRVYVSWLSEQNTPIGSNDWEEDIYAQRITKNDCVLGVSCGLYNNGSRDELWVGEVVGDPVNVRSGTLNSESFDSIVYEHPVSGYRFIVGAFMLGFEHKDGITTQRDYDYLETRIDGFRADVSDPESENTMYEEEGFDPYQFASFSQWQQDDALTTNEIGNSNYKFFDTAGTDESVVKAELQTFDGSVSSDDIVEGSGNVWGVQFTPTEDVPANTEARYFICTNNQPSWNHCLVWQEIDRVDFDSVQPLVLGSGEYFDKLEPNLTLHWRVFFKTNDATDISKTPTVSNMNIEYYLDNLDPVATVTNITDSKAPNYNTSDFVITAEASDTGGSGVKNSSLWYRYSETGTHSGSFIEIPDLSIAGVGPYSWTCDTAGGSGDGWRCYITGDEPGAVDLGTGFDGSYQFAATATDRAYNSETSPPTSAEDTAILDTSNPTLDSTTPPDLGEGVPPTMPISMYFLDTPSATGGMDTSTVESSISIYETLIPLNTITISDFTWSNGDLNLVIDHVGDDFIPGLNYTVQIAAGGEDKAGNPLAPSSFTFNSQDGAYIVATTYVSDEDETDQTSITTHAEESLDFRINLNNIGTNDAEVFNMLDQLAITYIDYEPGSATHNGAYFIPEIIWPVGGIGEILAGEQLDIRFTAVVKDDLSLPVGWDFVFTNFAEGDGIDTGTGRPINFMSAPATITIERFSDIVTSTFSVTDEVGEGETITSDQGNTPARQEDEGNDTYVYQTLIVNTGYKYSETLVEDTMPEIDGFDFIDGTQCELDPELEGECYEARDIPFLPVGSNLQNIAFAIGPSKYGKGTFDRYDPIEGVLRWRGFLMPGESTTLQYYAEVAKPDDFSHEIHMEGSDPLDLGIDTDILGQSPDMTSALAADDGSNCDNIPQTGDTVALSFDIPTNEYVINTGNINTVLNIDGSNQWGSVSAGWDDSQTLKITLTDDSSTIEIGDTFPVQPGTIQDDLGLEDATGNPPAITGTFGAACAAEEFHLKFMTAETDVETDNWSDTIIVATVDGDGDEVDMTGFCGPVPIQLTSDSTTERFKDDEGGEGGDGYEISIPIGSTSTSFFYKDATAGTFTMTVAENSDCHELQPDTQDILVYLPGEEPVYEYKLIFTTPAQEIKAGEVSKEMKVQLQKNGSALDVSATTTLNLTSTSGTGKFYSDKAGKSQVTTTRILAGESTSETFYYKDTVAKIVVIYAAEAPSQGWKDASQTEKILTPTGGDPTKRGCTDSQALNYDEDAEVDDGSCEYEGGVERKPSIFDSFDNFFQVVLDFLKDSFKDTFSAIKFLALALALLNYLLLFRFFSFLIYLLYLLNYILEAISEKKKRKAWGQIYNSVNKQPVDIALVRLFEIKDGEKKLVATKVTDREGRFGFAAEPGKYVMEVSKQGFTFPSKLVPKGFLKDDVYTDLYHGDELKMDPTNVNKKTGELKLAVNIPVDPITEERVRQKILGEAYVYGVWLSFWYWVRINLKKIVIPLLLVSFGMSAYSLWQNQYLIDLIFMIITSLILIKEFRDLVGRPTYGMVYDAKTKAPIANALVQIMDASHKVRSRILTDRGGHFYFLVPKGKYQLKVSKPGYNFPSKFVKTKNDPPYHSVYSKGEVVMKSGGVIVANVPMDKA